MTKIEIIILNALIIFWLAGLAKTLINGRFSQCTLGFLASGMQALGEMKGASRAQNLNNQGALYATYMEGKAYDAERAKIKPWEEFGKQNLMSFKDLLGYNGSDKQAASMEALRNSPAYQLRLNEGTSTIDRAAAAGGRFNSGRTGMALAKYGQDYASNEYNNEYNRRYGLSTDAYNTDLTTANMAGNYYRNKGRIVQGNSANNAAIQYREYSDIGKARQQAADNTLSWVSTLYGGGKGGGAMNNMKGEGAGNNPYGNNKSLYS